MSIVNVNLPDRPYCIHIESGLLDNLGEYVKKYYFGQSISIITDANVAKLYEKKAVSKLEEAGFVVKSFVVQPGEGSKSFSTYEYLTEKLAAYGHSRTDLILALGGGVIGDLSGFLAASYMRGVPVIQVPTSLLSQIDSSVGGKTGINIKAGKNLVGAIYQPLAVLIDPQTLNTLPKKYLRDGIGEAIKYGFIDRPDLLDIFEMPLDGKDAFDNILEKREEIINICCESKRDFVMKDERDFGKRMILNYGHTIGHAIEKVYNYEKYTHGEAVAMGMYYIQSISEYHKISNVGLVNRLAKLLKRYDLFEPCMQSSSNEWINTIAKDKKNLNSKLNIIFVEMPGKPLIYETTLEVFHEMMKEVLA